jgi:hypothetical protein
MSDLEEELEALVEEWREDAEVDAAMDMIDAADRREQCANDVEQLLEELV